MLMLKRADKKRYGNLLIGLKNSYLLGKDDYPTTVGGVIKVLNNYKSEWQQRETQTRTAPVSFLQANGGRVHYLKATNNAFFPRIT